MIQYLDIALGHAVVAVPTHDHCEVLGVTWVDRVHGLVNAQASLPDAWV